MDLSVVIVSYNVRYFLEQCLLSVERAVEELSAEVWVVDNHSVDSSVDMVRERFPWVKLIANRSNPGFSVANNQAIRQSSGRYVLLLNPDTVVNEDTFVRCLAFAHGHPDCGGLGVRMIDGSGRFLPESKRGLPTPWVAFTKAFGLSRLFPRSPRYNGYHLGYLSEFETHRVDVLAGAFMWMRREALDSVGLLDEDFFMYGEDIDLSYRLRLGGYENYYYPGTSIIHYKGESTKRGSLNYVKIFYEAMIIFARKHFEGGQARALVGLMRVAIYLRAVLTIIGNVWQRFRFPLLDAAGIYLGLRVLKVLWSNYHFGDPNYFEQSVDYIHFPAYTMLWIGCVFLGGGYDRPYDAPRLLRSLGIGTLVLLAIYGLLPEDLRPSRALLVLGSLWAAGWTLSVRAGLHWVQRGTPYFSPRTEARLLIVGGVGEAERALGLLQRAGAVRNYLGRIAPTPTSAPATAPVTADAIGTADRLAVLAQIYRAEELIFCSADLSVDAIQQWMSRLGPGIQYHILPEASASIIGSRRSDRRGTLYTIDANQRITEPVNRRGKWLMDRAAALLFLLTWPVFIWFVDTKFGLLSNAWLVLLGHRSWVGYHPGDRTRHTLPLLKPGVIYPGIDNRLEDPETIHHLNVLYARDYTVGEDWRILFANLRYLGR